MTVRNIVPLDFMKFLRQILDDQFQDDLFFEQEEYEYEVSIFSKVSKLKVFEIELQIRGLLSQLSAILQLKDPRSLVGKKGNLLLEISSYDLAPDEYSATVYNREVLKILEKAITEYKNILAQHGDDREILVEIENIISRKAI